MNAPAKYVKEYVEVMVSFAPDGTMLPRCLVWQDGHRYEIDRNLNRTAAYPVPVQRSPECVRHI